MPVGVDVVARDRIAADVARWGDAFMARVLTPAESAWCRAEPDPIAALAACVAAKEAVVKVIGGRPRGFDWQSVELKPGVDAGRARACRELVDRVSDGGGDERVAERVVGHFDCALDPAIAPDWRNITIEAAAVTYGAHVVAVAAA